MTLLPVVAESVPHADAEQELPAMLQPINASPASEAVICMDWPASMVIDDEEMPVMPLPAYPPAPQPASVNQTIVSRRSARHADLSATLPSLN